MSKRYKGFKGSGYNGERRTEPMTDEQRKKTEQFENAIKNVMAAPFRACGFDMRYYFD